MGGLARGIEVKYIQPDNPQQNAYVERFNRTVRQKYLEMNEFATLGDAQHLATEWVWMYNHECPNMAIGGVTPAMKYKKTMSRKNSCSNPPAKNGAGLHEGYRSVAGQRGECKRPH